MTPHAGALVLALSQADVYYQEQQRLARIIRRGFLDLAKARLSAGASSPISALDCHAFPRLCLERWASVQ